MMGGSAIAALRYAEYLHQQDPGSVTLLAPGNPKWDASLQKAYPFIETVQVPFFDKIVVSGKVSLVKARLSYTLIFLKTLLKMWQLKDGYDRVHLFDCWLDFNFCAIKAGKILGKKVLVEACLMGADDPDTIISKGEKSRNSIHGWRMRDYLKADYYVSKSLYMSEVFAKHFSTDRYRTIPYFVDTGKFFPANEMEQRDLKRKYAIPENKSVILFIGAIIPRKGAKELVEAFMEFSRTHPDYFLLMVSPLHAEPDDYQKKVLASLSQQNEEQYRVYTKVIDFVPDLMRLCSLYCLPSTQEGLPISICEAMCCGKFVVASDIKEIKKQQIDHLINGYLCKPADKDSILGGFHYFVDNNENANQIASLAAREAMDKFSLELILQKYISLYRE